MNSGADDDAVLDSAAAEGRILLTHDVSTLIRRAVARIAAGEAMPGVIGVALSLPTGAAIDDLSLIAECSASEEWENQVRYLPLR